MGTPGGHGHAERNRLSLTLSGFPESQRELDGVWTQVRPQDAWSQLVGRAAGSGEAADLTALATGPVLRYQGDEGLLMLPMVGGWRPPLERGRPAGWW